MKLSVIMPVYNRERYVVPALRSLLRQRDAADLDIIVVDDGSTDGSAEAVRSMMVESPCIRLFRQENMGVARTRNAGLRQLPADAEFVSFLDSDDISLAGRFKTDLARFGASPGLELTYSLMTLADRIDDERLEPAVDSRTVTLRGISLSTALFRRSLVERTGQFDEEFEQSEDTDYLLRVFETGPNYELLDTVAIYYRRHAGNVTREHSGRVRNHLRAIHKSMRRRKADPSLREVPGIFELKSPLNDWQM
ncbi:glycosyltransferase family A protein [Mesorhizobium sp. NZP2077]|uniref:glycosyltransferase family 2 protein n=2 Tax=Mesorhizobium sp. NZP2077 TaxID=2483404 RepID=UPI001553E448|nr:glycosyltransferase family A protein [Mesorhizobium sp. NZP2077]QKD13952.1 glycosyltransferase family 2 protein [Mesorhizobium sp. NZP2077]